MNKSSNYKTETKNIRFEHFLIELIDKQIESDPTTKDFSSWVREACKQRLKNENNIDFKQAKSEKASEYFSFMNELSDEGKI